MINLSFVRSKHFDDTHHQLILSLQASCCQLSPGAEGGRGGGEGGEGGEGVLPPGGDTLHHHTAGVRAGGRPLPVRVSEDGRGEPGGPQSGVCGVQLLQEEDLLSSGQYNYNNPHGQAFISLYRWVAVSPGDSILHTGCLSHVYQLTISQMDRLAIL